MNTLANLPAVTPHRRTSVVWDVPELELNWYPWSEFRPAAEIGHEPGAAVRTTYLAGLGWCLEPYQVTQWFEKTITQQGIIRQSEWNLVPELKERPHWRLPNVLGVTLGPELSSSGDHFLHKEPQAGQPFSSSLTADADALPPPPLASLDIPMDRVASSKQVYEANQGLCVRFQAPGGQLGAADNLLTVYAGGTADLVTQASPQWRPRSAAAPNAPASGGGTLAVNFRGDGKGTVWEHFQGLVGGGWKLVTQFLYAAPGQVSARNHQVVLGFSRSTASIVAAQPAPVPRGPGIIASPVQPPRPAPPVTVIRPSRRVHPQQTQKRTATGPGPVRLDLRQDLRVPVQISVLKYPLSGTLRDGAFVIPFPLPEGTPLQLNLDTDLPPGTAITYALYDALTETELFRDPETDLYVTPPGGRAYYAVFTFTTESDTRTPYLRSYEVWASGRATITDDLSWSGGKVMRVALIGTATDGSLESGTVELEDPAAELLPLKARGRFRARVQTTYDPEDPTKFSVLGEYELERAHDQRKGTTLARGGFGQGAPLFYPSPEWREYECLFSSLVQRYRGQLSFMEHRDFRKSKEDPTLPYKITDILREVLIQVGIHPDDLDIPDLPIRAFPAEDGEDFLLQPLADLWGFAQQLAEDYLGGYLLWDPNAGTTGRAMVRLVIPPTTPGTPLYHFHTGLPAGATDPRVYTSPGAYGPDATFVRHYSSYLEKPEANLIIVTASGELLPNNGGPSKRVQAAFNRKSFNFDPDNPTEDRNHPDWLGYLKPLVYFDPLITTQEELDFLTRRLYEQTCHGRKRLEWNAPLALITDPSDPLQSRPRPLRPWDAVTFNGETVVIRNARPAYEDDAYQWCDYEGVVILSEPAE